VGRLHIADTFKKGTTMTRIRTILHPTDFSGYSDHALELAYSLARDYDARLILFYVHEPPILAPAEVSYVPAPVYEPDTFGQEQLELRKPPEPNIAVERFVREGEPATEIVRFAQEHNCDLIVMGTHGRTGLRRLLMGSVAERVLRHASCPVMTVNQPGELAGAVPEQPAVAAAARPE
jgi:nucleotide-binding universal stress UspA family protein